MCVFFCIYFRKEAILLWSRSHKPVHPKIEREFYASWTVAACDVTANYSVTVKMKRLLNQWLWIHSGLPVLMMVQSFCRCTVLNYVMREKLRRINVNLNRKQSGDIVYCILCSFFSWSNIYFVFAVWLLSHCVSVWTLILYHVLF